MNQFLRGVQSKMNLKWIIISQSWVLFGSGLVFPFYIIFIREVGGNFSQFGLAYGMFMLSSAFVHRWVGRVSDKFGRKIFLLINAWGTAVLFLLFPMVTSIWEVYILQVLLGVLGAMQKTSEKALIADFTEGNERGKHIGVLSFLGFNFFWICGDCRWFSYRYLYGRYYILHWITRFVR